MNKRDRLEAACDAKFEERRDEELLARTEIDQLRAELATLRRYVAHNDEEYVTMHSVLRAEHKACQQLRAELAAVSEARGAELRAVGRKP